MKRFFYIPIFLLLVVYSPISHAQVPCAKKGYENIFGNILQAFRDEYYYYALHYDDGTYFPASRETEFINDNIEKLKKITKDQFYGCHTNDEQTINIMAYMANLPMAKLFLKHGANLFENYESVPPLLGVVAQRERDKNPKKFSSHNELIEEIYYGLYINNFPDLPINYAIALSKLYLALGVNIDATAEIEDYFPYRDEHGNLIKKSIHNALQLSLFAYAKKFASHHIKPDEQHRADDLKPPNKSDEDPEWHYYYYRSPVTYWLETFIEFGYLAQMLDTHQMLYPHFMRTARPETIKRMLANPDKYTLKANINCPYEEACPLTPSMNMRDAMGRTPLHIAGLMGNKAVYDLLISNGADTSIQDFRDNLPVLK